VQALVGALDRPGERSLTASLDAAACGRIAAVLQAAVGGKAVQAATLRSKLRQLAQHYDWHTLAQAAEYRGRKETPRLPPDVAATVREAAAAAAAASASASATSAAAAAVHGTLAGTEIDLQAAAAAAEGSATAKAIVTLQQQVKQARSDTYQAERALRAMVG
jgi:hypothetical protein